MFLFSWCWRIIRFPPWDFSNSSCLSQARNHFWKDFIMRSSIYD